jgi:PAS domain S-box-containing protein
MPKRKPINNRKLQQEIEPSRPQIAEVQSSTELIEQLKREQQALQVANEELRTTEEELRVQADELIASKMELERTRERYEELFNEAPDGYVVTDSEGVIQEVNKAAARLLGHTAKGLTARPIYRLPNFIPSIAKKISPRSFPFLNLEAIPNRPLVTQGFPLEGKPFWAAITASASYDSAGTPTSLRWLIRDITESRRAEQALRESEEKFSRAFSSNPAATVLSRLEDGKILDVNETWMRLFEYSREESIGRSCRTLGIWPNTESSQRYVGELKEKGFLRGWERDFHKRSGESFVAQLSAQVLNIQGEDVILSTLVDITDRKKAEHQLKELNDSLEKRVEERTLEAEHRALQLRQLATELTLSEQRERQRLAMVLHDGLQQILVAAKFNATLLECGGDVREKAVEISGLIDDCIATSRNLTVELSPPILYKGGLVPALEWLARSLQDKYGLRVRMISREPIEDPPDGVNILLFHSVHELLLNVVKHAGTKKAVIEVTQDAGRIQIEVADEGVGFDINQIGSKDINSGGMGLFSIKERLNYLGGRMEIESISGKGSRFRLITPPVKALEPASEIKSDMSAEFSIAVVPPSEPGRSRGRKIRIVLVDDHLVMRQGLAGLLRAEPDINIVGEASDGESSIKLAHDLQPDIVLMDISMPGMDGIQATRIIHQEMPDIKIIGLSMFQEGAQAAAICDAGAVDYLTKSGPARALIEAIHNAVRKTSNKARSWKENPRIAGR